MNTSLMVNALYALCIVGIAGLTWVGQCLIMTARGDLWGALS